MNLKTSLNFSVDKVNFEEVKNSRFSKAVIHAFADGQNAHTLPIETDVLKKSANSIYDIPILCKYSEYVDDFLGHEEDEIPIGFIKEDSSTYQNPIIFEKAEDGRTFIVIKGLIWNRYSKNAIEILKRDDKKKSVSVEITIIDGEEVDDKILVKEFVLEGITILGDFVTPAVKGANILLEFSKDKKDYLKSLMENKRIKIDNSKESAVSGKWSNPRRKLFVPIERAENKKTLLKEAYLINEGDYENPEISKLKYPHHVIRDGSLVLHIDGLQAAFKRAKQQGIFTGSVKSHIARHYKELGLSKENFATFGLEEEDFCLYFSETKEESVGETEMQDNEFKEIYESEEVVENCDNMADETCVGGMAECKCDDEEEVVEKDEEVVVDDEKHEEDHDDEEKDEDHDDDDDEDKDSDDDDDDDDDDDNEEEMSLEDAKKKIAEMAEQIDTLQSENTAYMTKIQEMSDYEDLKKFKADTLEKERQEKEMADMKKIMSEIEARGISMTDAEKEEMMQKAKDFESMDAWANYVKAQVFDKYEPTGFVGFALPYSDKKSDSVWDRI